MRVLLAMYDRRACRIFLQRMQSISYTVAPRTFLLDNANRHYRLRIHDLPREEKPREKMLSHGAHSLATNELLAVLLNTGTKKEEVLSMSARIMKEYGERSLARVRNAQIFSDEHDIPLGKAMQIVAALELGRRFFEKNDSAAPILRTAEDVFEYVKDMRDLSKEHLRGIYLNTHYKVIRDETISIGTVDTNIVHPREVFKPALEYCASAVVLVHNHPSGTTAPSQADIEMTEQLITAGRILGIELIDHVIVTRKSFASIPASYNNA